MKLRHIHYLLEAQNAEQVYERHYSDIDREVFDQIVKADTIDSRVDDDGSIKKVGAGAKWLLKNYRTGNLLLEDLYKFADVYKNFKRFKGKLEKKDINSYDNIGEITEAIDRFVNNKTDSSLMTKKQRIENVEIVADNSDMIVYRPLTYEAANKLGKNPDGTPTEWCTNIKDHYEYYSNKGPLYVVVSKKDQWERYQIHVATEQCMNRYDRPEFDAQLFASKNKNAIEALSNILRETFSIGGARGGLEMLSKFGIAKNVDTDILAMSVANCQNEKKISEFVRKNDEADYDRVVELSIDNGGTPSPAFCDAMLKNETLSEDSKESIITRIDSFVRERPSSPLTVDYLFSEKTPESTKFVNKLFLNGTYQFFFDQQVEEFPQIVIASTLMMAVNMFKAGLEDEFHFFAHHYIAVNRKINKSGGGMLRLIAKNILPGILSNSVENFSTLFHGDAENYFDTYTVKKAVEGGNGIIRKDSWQFQYVLKMLREFRKDFEKEFTKTNLYSYLLINYQLDLCDAVREIGYDTSVDAKALYFALKKISLKIEIEIIKYLITNNKEFDIYKFTVGEGLDGYFDKFTIKPEAMAKALIETKTPIVPDFYDEESAKAFWREAVAIMIVKARTDSIRLLKDIRNFSWSLVLPEHPAGLLRYSDLVMFYLNEYLIGNKADRQAFSKFFFTVLKLQVDNESVKEETLLSLVSDTSYLELFFDYIYSPDINEDDYAELEFFSKSVASFASKLRKKFGWF